MGYFCRACGAWYVTPPPPSLRAMLRERSSWWARVWLVLGVVVGVLVGALFGAFLIPWLRRRQHEGGHKGHRRLVLMAEPNRP